MQKGRRKPVKQLSVLDKKAFHFNFNQHHFCYEYKYEFLGI